jgi:hypothetical protein
MTMETNELVTRLVADTTPVRRLSAPWLRMLLWLAVSLPYVAAVVLLMPMHVNWPQAMVDRPFMIEQIATLVTALAAAVAAFCSVVPGYDRKIVWLPLAPLAVWLATLGRNCWQDWIGAVSGGLQLRPDWDCLLPAALAGIIPAVAMVIMLRRGAPLVPRVTLALGALAVAALANFGLRLFHLGDASIMVLFWHFGSVGVLSVMAAFLGRFILRWRHVERLAGT